MSRCRARRGKCRIDSSLACLVFIIMFLLFLPNFLSYFKFSSGPIVADSTISVPITWKIETEPSSINASLSPLIVLKDGESITSLTAIMTLDYEIQGTIVNSVTLDRMRVLFDGKLKKQTPFVLPNKPTPLLTIGTLEVTASEIEAWAGSSYGEHTIIFDIPVGGTFTVGLDNGTTKIMNIQASSKSVTVTYHSVTPSYSISYTIWKVSNLIHARNEKTGAVITNSNPQTLFQNVINLLSLAGGGVIHLEAGTYSNEYAFSSVVTLKSNIIIEGEDETSTILDSIDFVIACENVTIRDLGLTGSKHTTAVIECLSGASNVTLERITAESVVNVWGVFMIAPSDGDVLHDFRFIDLTARNCDGCTCIIMGETIDASIVRNIWWTRCKSYNAGLQATRKNDWVVGISLTERSKVENFWVVDCVAEGSWESGIHAESAPTKINVHIENCECSYNGQKPNAFYGYGFLVNAGITVINPQGIGNKNGLIWNYLNGAIVY